MIFVPPWQSWALRDMSFDPRHVPGCQLFACTDTGAYPTGVVFPADPLVDGNMDAANTAAWTAMRSGVLSKEAGPPRRLRVTVGALSYPGASQALVSGNRYRLRGRWRSDGVRTPFVNFGAGTQLDGTTSTDWADVDWTATADANYFQLGVNSAATPGNWCEFDDWTVTPLNASQLTDLTGLGHHLVQATAAKQPLFVASGAGGVLRFDGSADYLQTGAFALAQPTTLFLLAAYTKKGTATYLTDGVGGTNLGVITHNGVADSIISFCGTSLLGPAFTTAQPYVIDTCFNAASSYVALNGGAKTTGQTGAAAPSMGGVTIGAAGNGAVPSIADVYGVVVYNRALSEPERQRVVRYLRRLGARLGVSIP